MKPLVLLLALAGVATAATTTTTTGILNPRRIVRTMVAYHPDCDEILQAEQPTTDPQQLELQRWQDARDDPYHFILSPAATTCTPTTVIELP